MLFTIIEYKMYLLLLLWLNNRCRSSPVCTICGVGFQWLMDYPRIISRIISPTYGGRVHLGLEPMMPVMLAKFLVTKFLVAKFLVAKILVAISLVLKRKNKTFESLQLIGRYDRLIDFLKLVNCIVVTKTHDNVKHQIFLAKPSLNFPCDGPPSEIAPFLLPCSLPEHKG